MIDTVVNLLFRCAHRRLTRPVTPVGKDRVSQSGTYVVCLDCGKQFAYDLREMRVGKPVEVSPDSGVLPPELPKPRTSKAKYAFWAGFPVAVALGAVLRHKKRAPEAVSGQARSLPERRTGDLARHPEAAAGRSQKADSRGAGRS